MIAAYPNFYPVCHYAQHEAKDAATAVPSTEERPNHHHPHPHRFAGLEVDLLAKFCAQWGLEPELFAVGDFDGIWTYPARGLADVAIGGITSSPTRNDPAIRWSEPYFTVRAFAPLLPLHPHPSLIHPHIIFFQVTRTLVYHRRNPPKGLAFPQGVEGVIRGTPGSTGA